MPRTPFRSPARPPKPVPVQAHRDTIAAAAASLAERDQLLTFRLNQDEVRKLDELVSVSALPTRAAALRALIAAGHDSTIEEPVRRRLASELAKDETGKAIDEHIEELAAVMLEKSARKDEKSARKNEGAKR